MMNISIKQFILLLLFCSVGATLSSQEKGLVYYGQIESVSLKGPYGPDFNSYLVFNDEGSYYVTAKDSLDTDTVFQKVYYNADGSQGMSYSVYTNPIGKQVYYNRAKDSVYWNQWQTFYVAEKRPEIGWSLENETKPIGNFTAHKATGKFRGRVYTAWYTLEIPLPYGPWKLQGLPGLILEAYDENKEMYLYFKSLEYPTNSTAEIKQITWPDDLPKQWKTLDDFKKRLDFFYEKRKNTSVTIAQKLGTDVPEEKIKSEVFLESF